MLVSLLLDTGYKRNKMLYDDGNSSYSDKDDDDDPRCRRWYVVVSSK